MKIFNDWKNLLYFIIILILLIFFLAGFLLGHIISSDNSCTNNPLSYGLKKINKINDVDLTCSCFSMDGEINPFTFDETGIRE